MTALTQPEIRDAPAAADAEPILSAWSVGFEVRGARLVSNLSFEIRPGEVAIVVGANGAGKTTLLRLLGGLLQPTAGEVVLAGKSVGRWSSRDRARLIASVPQYSRWASMSVCLPPSFA